MKTENKNKVKIKLSLDNPFKNPYIVQTKPSS